MGVPPNHPCFHRIFHEISHSFLGIHHDIPDMIDNYDCWHYHLQQLSNNYCDYIYIMIIPNPQGWSAPPLLGFCSWSATTSPSRTWPGDQEGTGVFLRRQKLTKTGENDGFKVGLWRFYGVLWWVYGFRIGFKPQKIQEDGEFMAFLLVLSREKLRTNWFYREKKGCYDVPLGNQGDTSWDFGQWSVGFVEMNTLSEKVPTCLGRYTHQYNEWRFCLILSKRRNMSSRKIDMYNGDHNTATNGGFICTGIHHHG